MNLPTGISQRRQAHPQITFKTAFRNVIYDVFLSRGWKQVQSELDWDILWCERDWMQDTFDKVTLNPWQRVNHFRYSRELCRKDLLHSNVKAMKRRLEAEKKFDEIEKFNFTPIGFELPREFNMLVEEFKRDLGVPWIMKPVGESQGHGIFLFDKLQDIQKWNSETKKYKIGMTWLAQKYITNPYLVGGKKFDIRLYVLVTSYLPLTIYVNRTGFCRFTNSPYDMSNMSDKTIHLTNVAVQIHAEDYDSDTGGKWMVRDLRKYIEAKHGKKKSDELFNKIQQIFINSILCVKHVLRYDKHCFELYGYDIMIDDQLKPWLIEVNAAPSLYANTLEDKKLKFAMLNDMLDIIDLENKRFHNEDNSTNNNNNNNNCDNTINGEIIHNGTFDLVYKDGYVNPDSETGYPKCMIGCRELNDGERNRYYKNPILKQINKSIFEVEKEKKMKLEESLKLKATPPLPPLPPSSSLSSISDTTKKKKTKKKRSNSVISRSKSISSISPIIPNE